MGEGNKVEFLVAICALLTSAMAVFMAWDQGRVMRAQQHGAVFPVLQVDGFVSTTPNAVSMGVRVGNSGVGPALIEDVSIVREDRPFTDLSEYHQRLPQGFDLSWAGLTGRSLAPGAEVTPMQISWDHDSITPALFAATAEEWSRLDIRVCYCSVFDRCWVTSMNSTSRAGRTDRCPSGRPDIFEALGNLAPAAETSASDETD